MRLPARPSGPASSQRRSTQRVGAAPAPRAASRCARRREPAARSAGACPRAPACATGARTARARSPSARDRRGATRAPAPRRRRTARAAPRTSRLTAAASFDGVRTARALRRRAAAADCSSGGAGSSTVYFARIASYASSRARSFCSASHAVLHVGLDLFERRHAAGDDGVDEHEVPAVAGLDRPLPGARRELRDRQRELRPELLRELLRRAVAVVVLEHERVGERARRASRPAAGRRASPSAAAASSRARAPRRSGPK